MSKSLSTENTHRVRLLLERYVRMVLGQVDPFCVDSMEFRSGEDHARFDFESEEGPQGENTELLQRFQNLFPQKRLMVFADRGVLQVHLVEQPPSKLEYLSLSEGKDYILTQYVTVRTYQNQGTVAIIKDLIEKHGVYLDYFGVDPDDHF